MRAESRVVDISRPNDRRKGPNTNRLYDREREHTPKCAKSIWKMKFASKEGAAVGGGSCHSVNRGAWG